MEGLEEDARENMSMHPLWAESVAPQQLELLAADSTMSQVSISEGQEGRGACSVLLLAVLGRAQLVVPCVIQALQRWHIGGRDGSRRASYMTSLI